MRILLVAYDFPPSPSPQSLRWAYLARELVRAGHELHVLTTEPAWAKDGLPPLPPQMHIHRITGGPIASAMARLVRRQAAARRRTARGSDPPLPAGASAPTPPGPPGEIPAPMVAQPLNWKGRLVKRLESHAANLLYPDLRGEWLYPARREAERLVATIQPDVVVTSHEPPMALELGARLRRRHSIPWLADLGDPVLADYTPERWRRRALRVERRVMRRADAITVTAPGTRDLLVARHGAPTGRGGIGVLSQGFDDTADAQRALPPDFFDDRRLELLYTGSFYSFRRSDALFDAIEAVPGVRLTLATSAVPDWLRDRLDAHPDRFRLLGFMPHVQVLAVQRRADVLVNIANDNPCQVPGKVYEYLGARRPILHTGNIVPDDVSAGLVLERRRGWVRAGRAEVEALLRSLLSRKGGGVLETPELDLGEASVAEFSWRHQAGRLAATLAALAGIRPVVADMAPRQGY